MTAAAQVEADERKRLALFNFCIRRSVLFSLSFLFAMQMSYINFKSSGTLKDLLNDDATMRKAVSEGWSPEDLLQRHPRIQEELLLEGVVVNEERVKEKFSRFWVRSQKLFRDALKEKDSEEPTNNATGALAQQQMFMAPPFQQHQQQMFMASPFQLQPFPAINGHGFGAMPATFMRDYRPETHYHKEVHHHHAPTPAPSSAAPSMVGLEEKINGISSKLDKVDRGVSGLSSGVKDIKKGMTPFRNPASNHSVSDLCSCITFSIQANPVLIVSTIILCIPVSPS